MVALRDLQQEYARLLRQWLAVEPQGPADQAEAAFDKLGDELAGMDEETDRKAMKGKVKLRFEGWLRYYKKLYSCLAKGQDPGALDKPEDWA